MPGIAKNISEILSSTHQHTLSTAILHLYKNDLIPQLRVLVRHPEPPRYHLSMQLLYKQMQINIQQFSRYLLHNSITTGSLKTQSKNSSGIS